VLVSLSIVNGCVFDQPKEIVQIVNTSSSDTIYVFSGHCLENLDSILVQKKHYFDIGLNKIIKNPYFLNPLDTLNLSLGYTLLPVINSCNDKEAKVFIFKGISLDAKMNKFLNYQNLDTTFSLTENSVQKGIFYYKSKNN